MFSPTAINLGGDTTICNGEAFLLSIQDSDYTITWQDGSHQPQILIDQAQVYWVALSNECGMNIDSIEVSIDSLKPALSWNEIKSRAVIRTL